MNIHFMKARFTGVDSCPNCGSLEVKELNTEDIVCDKCKTNKAIGKMYSPGKDEIVWFCDKCSRAEYSRGCKFVGLFSELWHKSPKDLLYYFYIEFDKEYKCLACHEHWKEHFDGGCVDRVLMDKECWVISYEEGCLSEIIKTGYIPYTESITELEKKELKRAWLQRKKDEAKET